MKIDVFNDRDVYTRFILVVIKEYEVLISSVEVTAQDWAPVIVIYEHGEVTLSIAPCNALGRQLRTGNCFNDIECRELIFGGLDRKSVV